MIRFTLRDASPVLINPRVIFSVMKGVYGTVIHTELGTPVEVTEPFDEVERRLKAWGKG